MAARRTPRKPVAPVALIYHDILGPAQTDPDVVGFPGPIAKRYKLARSEFEAHLGTIVAENLRVGRYDDPASDVEVLLTFDDGGASAALTAEMLAAHDWPGHFFLTTARIGTPGFLDEQAIRGLAAAGHVIGSHSHTHPAYMRELDTRDLSREWRTSRDVLTEILGVVPVVAAIPGGSLSPPVVRAVHEAGYETVMTSEPRRRRRVVDGVDVIDRYTIWSTTTSERVRGYLTQTLPSRSRLRIEWELKKALKQTSPSLYQRARRIRARI